MILGNHHHLKSRTQGNIEASLILRKQDVRQAVTYIKPGAKSAFS